MIPGFYVFFGKNIYDVERTCRFDSLPDAVAAAHPGDLITVVDTTGRGASRWVRTSTGINPYHTGNAAEWHADHRGRHRAPLHPENLGS